MAKEKKVEQITDMEVDFAQWFTDVCTKAQLIDYSSIKGVFIYRPYGYAIWENIQAIMDKEFKKQGVENVYMPLLIPESLLQKEKDHVEGFAPECAWVTYGGNEKLEDRMAIRPTSETVFCEHYANVIHSWRDLPKLYNQWCSVLRWEKTSRPFLRHREFLWQEGHTIHATAVDAKDFTEAAEIAALNSKAEGENIAVDYAFAKSIKKPAGSKPGFVIYHTNWTAYVTPSREKVEKMRIK